MNIVFGDTLYSVLGTVIVISAILMVIIFGIGRILNNRELEQTSKEEMIEIAISILMIGVVSYLLTNPIQHFGCSLMINTILNDNSVQCDNPIAREIYVNNTLLSYLNMSYASVLDPNVYNGMNRLLKSYLSSKKYFIFGSISQDPLINDFMAITNVVGSPTKIIDEIKEERFYQSGEAISSGFSYMPCRHFSYIYESLNNLFSQINLYRSIIYAFRELFSPSLYPIFIIGFFSIGMIMRIIKITRKVGGFLISFSIALSLLPITTAFFLNLLTKIDTNMNPTTSTTNMVNWLGATLSNVPEPNKCFDIYLHRFDSTFRELYSASTNPDSFLIRFTVLSILALLSLGLALLTVISVTVGINQLLGIDVSPFVLSYIARVS